MHSSVEDYLAFLQTKDRAAATLKMVRQDLTCFISWWENQRRRPFDPKIMRFEDVRDWRNSRQQARKAVLTINRGLAVLRGYCKWAISHDWIATNPMSDLKDLPSQPLAPRSLPVEALDALLREAMMEDDARLRVRNQAMLALLIYTGMRVQEVCDMQIRDLDVAGGMVIVRRGKGNKARRLPLHPDAGRVLQQYIEEVRCPEGLPPIGGHEESHSLFVHKNITIQGQPLVPGIDQRLLQRLVLKLGEQAAVRLQKEAQHQRDAKQAEFLGDLARRLVKVTPHMLRHSLAKRLLDKGAKLTEVQRILGHNRLDTTARYLTPSEDDLRQALLKADL